MNEMKNIANTCIVCNQFHYEKDKICAHCLIPINDEVQKLKEKKSINPWELYKKRLKEAIRDNNQEWRELKIQELLAIGFYEKETNDDDDILNEIYLDIKEYLKPTFSTRLQELIWEREYHYTQSICEYLKIESSTVKEWLDGKRIPSAQQLIKLTRIFGCSIDYMLGRNDKVEELLLKKFRSLSVEQKTTVLNQIEKGEIEYSEQLNILLENFKSLSLPEQAQVTEYIQCLAERQRTNQEKKA